MLWMLTCTLFNLQAQSGDLSAAMTVLAEGVTLQRAGTDATFALRVGAVMPVGTGDIIDTGENGRVIIAFSDANQLYLLPQTHYELHDYSALDNGQLHIDGTLSGVAIQQVMDDPALLDYRLETSALTVTQPSNLFAVWALEGRFEAAVSAQGELHIQSALDATDIVMESAQGAAVNYSDEAFTLVPPYHVAQLQALAIDCPGTVSTNGSEGLRLRFGPALDYLVVRVLQDNEQVLVVGTTENGLWLSVPYQTGFGWLYADLVTWDCEGLPRYPDLVGNENEQIHDVTEPELEFLVPFYGDPQSNRVFYR